MIRRKSEKEIELMRHAGRIAAEARSVAGELVKPGAVTSQIDKRVREFIISRGGIPAFLNYRGYPATLCISVNDEVIHGIPSERKLEDGDIVSIDVGVIKDGYVGDCAATFVAGRADPESLRLIEVTRTCFYEGMKFAKVGYRISDISRAIQTHAEANGYSVVREFVGHGIGAAIHEPPEVPNFVERPRRKADPRLVPGMTLAVEPMVNAGDYGVSVLDDGWTVVTADGSPSAHYENTILITDGEPEILTICEVS
ncbi:MAG: type I methionyl aminopeptidase [Oscillospiraceae bacterium]|nr:type I methionyl aminopeptidase [Oscillospiraceae bacterium]